MKKYLCLMIIILFSCNNHDENKIAIAKKHLQEVTRSFRKLQEQVNILEEKLQVLEEASSMGAGSVAGFAGPIGTEEENND